MKVLAIDTSSNVLGVAVLDENGQGAEFNFNLGLRHASHLVPTIKKTLLFSGLGLKDIDAYCVSIGPGSFTGLRIGVSTIKALWLADKKKVAAVPTLDVLARNIPDTNGTICVIVDAKKEKLYAGFYKYESNFSDRRDILVPHNGGVGKPRLSKEGGNTTSPSPRRGEGRGEGAFLIGYDELLKRLASIKDDILLAGDGIPKLYALRSALYAKKFNITTSDFWYPRAINVARIGLEMLKDGKFVKDVDALTPVYLHRAP